MLLPGLGLPDPPALVVQVGGPPGSQSQHVVLTQREVYLARDRADGCAFGFLALVLFVLAIVLVSFPRILFSDFFSPSAAIGALMLPMACLFLQRWVYDGAIMVAAERARLAPGRLVDRAVVRALQERRNTA